ncbi:tyrosine-type recombinase/integrase (plasmid) [Thioclava sp. 'Guangxiensis']|uniref:tyrosine-type recombinase/integrase n=1 Tax=Thioclava sp. 'Guangxiensis' TaxID=3149044 RepID=UPI0032C41B76
MKVNLPGLISEILPSGKVRYRVRLAGDKRKRITLAIGPEHPRFHEHYHTARQGIQLALEADEKKPTEITGSVGWLVQMYLKELEAMLARDQLHKSTVHQRTVFLNWMRAQVGERSAAMPRQALVKLRDKKADTPGAADNFIKSVRAMYVWAIDRGFLTENPTDNMRKLNTKGKGATPWTLEDLKAFRETHPLGTKAHLALTLFMFTACRIGDAYQLGPSNIIEKDGMRWLKWTPQKAGSSPVEIPILAPLAKAIEATETGETFLLSGWGKPFASKDALGNWFRDRVLEAGLFARSPHGIRKAAGELLALNGASQYHIMSVHGHSNAKTSEVYTRGAERSKLAQQALETLRGIDW